MRNLKPAHKIPAFILTVLVFMTSPGTCHAHQTENSYLSPISNLQALQLQETFTYFSNQQSYQEYKEIFELSANEKPLSRLEGDDLAEFLSALSDIRSLVKIFSQGNAFDGLIRQWEKDIVDDFLTDHPKQIDLVGDSELKQDLREVIRNVQEQVESRERIQPDLAGTMHKELIFRLKRKLEKAASLLRPNMPIDSIHFNDKIMPYLEPGIIKRVIENISWQNHSPDQYSGQRKIIIHLDKPIKMKNGMIINSLEIKGVVYKKNGSIDLPRKQIYKMMKIASIDRHNLTRLIKRVHLKGAMPFAAAKREYMVLNKLFEQNGAEYDFPVGYGKYKNYTYKGKQFGFVITGVENSNRKRIADWYFDNFQAVFDLVNIDKVRFAKQVVHLFDRSELLLRRYGEELRRFHDKGFYHGYPHMLNISWDKDYEKIVLNDFEASRYIACLPAEKRVAYRMLDLSSAYVHFVSFITGDQTLYKLAAFSGLMNELGNPFQYFLEGYFGNDMPDYDFKEFMDDSIYPVVVEGVDVINELDSRIVTTLFNIEGADFERIDEMHEFDLGMDEWYAVLELESSI